MPDHESSEYTTPAGATRNDEQRAHLLAAGEALRNWASARRATWTDVPDAPRSGAPEPTWNWQPPVDVEPPKEPAATAPVAPPRARTIRITWGPVREPLIRWSRRVALAALVAAIVGGAAWAARAQWLKWSAAPRTGTAVLESVPPDSDIAIDGRPAGKAPLTVELPPGRHTVEFRRRAALRKLDVVVTAGQSTVGRLNWTAVGTGRLEVQSDPAGAAVLVDGHARGVTPLTINDLAAGSHNVVLESAKGSVQRLVDVTPDSTTEITEAIYSGWLHVTGSIELEIAEGTRALQLDGQNNVLLPPGWHSLRFENRRLSYSEVRQVLINPGKTTPLSIVAQAAVLTVTATLPADVFIDGERAGEAPLTNYRVSLGTRDILIKSRTGLERRVTVTVRAQPTRIDVDFSKP